MMPYNNLQLSKYVQEYLKLIEGKTKAEIYALHQQKMINIWSGRRAGRMWFDINFMMPDEGGVICCANYKNVKGIKEMIKASGKDIRVYVDGVEV